MNAMLIVAHGSRRSASNEEIRRLTKKVTPYVEDSHTHVGCAFLELAEPSIETGIVQLIQQGAKRITVVPYFLAQGTHVTDDIPQIVSTVQELHPGTEIVITDYLGKSEMIPEVLLNVALK